MWVVNLAIYQSEREFIYVPPIESLPRQEVDAVPYDIKGTEFDTWATVVRSMRLSVSSILEPALDPRNIVRGATTARSRTSMR